MSTQPGRARLGCLVSLVVYTALGLVALLAICAALTPWTFVLGGRFHPLASWQGWGEARSASGGSYVVFVRMFPTIPTRHGTPRVMGYAMLCTSRGAKFDLRLGGYMEKRPGTDSNGRSMKLDIYRWPWPLWVTDDERPRFSLTGAWHGPLLEMNDRGTLSQAFLANGYLYRGPASNRPTARETVALTLREGSTAEFNAACTAERRR